MRYHISPREMDVLVLIMRGCKLCEIGRDLYITISTVQDHLNSLLHKTQTRNRSAMIAKVLGWESP